MPSLTMSPVKGEATEFKGAVYCPLCTHTVEGKVVAGPKGPRVVPGQKCPRCSSPLDAGYVIRVERAA